MLWTPTRGRKNRRKQRQTYNKLTCEDLHVVDTDSWQEEQTETKKTYNKLTCEDLHVVDTDSWQEEQTETKTNIQQTDL